MFLFNPSMHFPPSLSSSGHHTLLSPNHERSHCSAFHSGLFLPNQRRVFLQPGSVSFPGMANVWLVLYVFGVQGFEGAHMVVIGVPFFFFCEAAWRVGTLVCCRAWLEKPHISTRGDYKRSSAWNSVFPPLLFYCSLSLFFFFCTSCPFQSLSCSSMWPLCTVFIHFLLELMPFLSAFSRQSRKQMWRCEYRTVGGLNQAFIHNNRFSTHFASILAYFLWYLKT